MIKGIGTDLLEKRRVEKSISKFGNKFVKKVLTEKEHQEYQTKKTSEKKVTLNILDSPFSNIPSNPSENTINDPYRCLCSGNIGTHLSHYYY